MTENQAGGPQGNPGEIINWPMLKIKYQTTPEAAAAVLPPGINPSSDSEVTLTVYNFPVNNEPELGVVTTVSADYNGINGLYTLGYGIDQEAAIFISQEMNGQPKYPCAIKFFRMLDQVDARLVVGVLDLDAGDRLLLIDRLLHLQVKLEEELMQLLVGKIDAQLLE